MEQEDACPPVQSRLDKERPGRVPVLPQTLLHDHSLLRRSYSSARADGKGCRGVILGIGVPSDSLLNAKSGLGTGYWHCRAW